jgi:hypothetical protein
MDFNAYYHRIVRVLRESRSDMYSWMNVDGKIFSISSHSKKDHGDLAKYLMADKNINTDQMFQMGYLRITYYGDDLYAHNNINKPNLRQLKELKDIAIENHMKKIVWDNEDEDRVLWYNENL